MFEIYKPGQGKHTRIITFLSVMVLGVLGALTLSAKIGPVSGAYIQFGIPTALVVGLGIFMFWVVNRPASADFMIATEGEMKKVSWSTKKEIIGSTKVVIVTTFIMAGILFGEDILLTVLFKWLGIMGG